MTTREFTRTLIEHSEEKPSTIDLDRAKQLVSLLDPAQIPPDLTPETFMADWNDIVEHDLPIGNWL